MNIFQEERLQAAASLQRAFTDTQPFPHLIMDEWIRADALDQAVGAFPQDDSFLACRYEREGSKQLSLDPIAKLPSPLQTLLQALNQATWLNFLERATGIEGLIPDPYFHGGGLQRLSPGSELKAHSDGNTHPKLRLHRRLNALLFLSGHQSSCKGILQLTATNNPSSTKEIDLNFNRLVLLGNGEDAQHSLRCLQSTNSNAPLQWISLYYYTSLPLQPFRASITKFSLENQASLRSESERTLVTNA